MSDENFKLPEPQTQDDGVLLVPVLRTRQIEDMGGPCPLCHRAPLRFHECNNSKFQCIPVPNEGIQFIWMTPTNAVLLRMGMPPAKQGYVE